MAYQVQVHHVMWQPIFHCIMGCKGCYISASETSKYSGPIATDIIDLIYKTEQVKCNQFTISLDTLADLDDRHTGLVRTLKYVWDLYKTTHKDLPELCITAFNLNTVEQWCRALGFSKLEDFLEPLTFLSLSNLPTQGKKCFDLKESCKKTSTVLNYNKMVDRNLKDDKSFEMGLRYSDQTYLVYKKNPLGSDQNAQSFQDYYDTYHSLNEESKAKVIIDSCLTDTVTYKQSGKTCGAGINKLHIWPDGSVTGCPYDSHNIMHTQKRTNLLEELEYVVYQRTLHSMNYCKIHKNL